MGDILLWAVVGLIVVIAASLILIVGPRQISTEGSGDQLLDEGDMAGAETWHRILNEGGAGGGGGALAAARLIFRVLDRSQFLQTRAFTVWAKDARELGIDGDDQNGSYDR